MPLEVPELDDRDFAELLEDARRRIPVHAEEWTDHNIHDPGITILELLAWVAESELYQADRIADEHVEKYLDLIGAPPHPPEPATARLELDPPPAAVGRTVPAGAPLAVEDVDGTVRLFETDAPVTLTDAAVGAVVSDHAGTRTDNTAANRTDGMAYRAFGPSAPRGSTVYVGFEGEPFVGGFLELGIEFNDQHLPAPAQHGREESTFEPTVEVTWEYCTDYEQWYRRGTWEDLTVLRDETSQLYTGGIVRFERPPDWNPDPVAILDRSRPFRWLRCRIAEPGHEIPPEFTEIHTNAVTATHRTAVTDEQLTRRDGGDRTTAHPHQAFEFEHAPVLSATVTVGGEPWREVDSLDASGPDDEHYVLEQAAGRIRFGDEVRGKIPEPDQRVVADEYVHGGGTAGNVAPAARWFFQTDELTGVSVVAHGVGGGRDADTIDEALTRLNRDRQTPYRAVTAADYRYVATHTPGLRFGRAAAVIDAPKDTNRAPDGCESHKRIRVVVVPYSTLDRPEPSDGFLAAVRDHIEEHRLLTDRVTVDPPEYVGIGVRAEIGLVSEYTERGRTAAVETALDEFLHPLEGYDGDGWPFGRPVYLSEVYEAIDAVDGVDCVFDVSLSPRGDTEVDADGNVVIGDGTLVYPATHDVSVRRTDDQCGGGS